MGERLYITPGGIRGGGLLVDSKEANEYICKQCILEKSTVTINSETVPVFTMYEAKDTLLTLSTGSSLTVNGYKWYPYIEDGTFTISVSLRDEDSFAISDASVVFISQDKPTSETVITNSSGAATATVNNIVGLFNLQCIYEGDSTSSPALSNSISNILKVKIGGCSIGVESSKNSLYFGDTCNFSARVLIDGTAYSGISVSFYDDDTYLGAGTTNTNGIATLDNVILATVGSRGVTARVGSETSEEVNVIVYPAVTPGSIAVTGPIAIQQSSTDNITALVTGTGTGGATVGVQGVNVDFYETFTPELLVSASHDVIQKDSTTTLSARIRDTDDNSKVIIPNLTVDFYETFDGIALYHNADESVGLTGDIVTLMVVASHANDTPYTGEVSFFEDGNYIGACTLSNGEGFFEYSISNKPLVHIYATIAGLTSDTIGIINSSDIFNERVDVVWVDEDESNRPESLTARLYAGGIEVANGVLSESTGWSYDFTQLPRYTEGGNLITYSIVLDPDDLYSIEVSKSENVTTATLTYNGGTQSFNLFGTIDTTGDSDVPSSWKFTIDGRTAYLSSANNYSAVMTGIPQYKNRELYTPEWVYIYEQTPNYQVHSTSVDGNTTTIILKYWPRITPP